MRATPSDSVSKGSHPSSEAQGDPSKGDINGAYEKNMDEMRCILYLHGGECPQFSTSFQADPNCQVVTISAASTRRGKRVPV